MYTALLNIERPMELALYKWRFIIIITSLNRTTHFSFLWKIETDISQDSRLYDSDFVCFWLRQQGSWQVKIKNQYLIVWWQWWVRICGVLNQVICEEEITNVGNVRSNKCGRYGVSLNRSGLRRKRFGYQIKLEKLRLDCVCHFTERDYCPDKSPLERGVEGELYSPSGYCSAIIKRWLSWIITAVSIYHTYLQDIL